MPYSPNANWNAETAALAKHPIYIVRFDGLASLQYSSGPVKSASRTTKQYISGGIEGLSQSVDPLTGRFSIGSVSFILTDIAGEVTDLIATEQASPDLATLLHRRVTILAGYAGLAETDYATIHVGFLTEIELTRDLSAFLFRLGDPKRATLEDIFTNADAGASKVDTTLTDTEPVGSIRIRLSSTANIAPDDKLILRQAASPNNEEVVTVRKVDGLAIVTKAATVYAYGAGDSCRWATTILSGPALNLYYSLLTGMFCKAAAAVSTTLDASAAAGQKVIPLTATTGIVAGGEYLIRKADGSYQEVVKVASISAGVSVTAHNNLARAYVSTDLFINTPFPLTSYQGLPTGLGVAPADIDATAIAAERDDLMVGLSLTVEVDRRTQAKSWMERELFRLFGYPVVTPEGKVSFKAFGPRRPTASILSLTEGDIVSWGFKRRFDIAYNRLVIRFDYDIENDRFVTQQVHEDTADQASVGVREIVIESRGLRTDGIADVFLRAYGARWLKRFMKGCPELRIRAHLTKRGAFLGEAADVAHAKIPNVRTGTRGMAAPVTTVPAPGYEVIRIDQRLDEGLIELTLQDNGFTRPMWIAPAGQPDYGAATATERRYWYISPVSGANFSDGTEPYKVI
jgi:hypothetical protein